MSNLMSLRPVQHAVLNPRTLKLEAEGYAGGINCVVIHENNI